MRTTFSIAFYCRASKASRQGYSPLELSLSVNGERLFINLPVKYRPEDFNRKRRNRTIETEIETWRSAVSSVVSELVGSRIPVTAATVREYLRSGGVRSRTIGDVWDEYMRTMMPSATADNRRKYRLAGERMAELLGGRGREIVTLTHGDMARLYDSLKAIYSLSTATGYFTKMKTVVTYAIDSGWLRTNPFNGIRITKPRGKVTYLTEEEIDKLRSVEPDSPRLERARDLLLFQIFSGGMAYCDMIEFNPGNIREIDGMMIYRGKRRKTGVEFTTVVLPEAMDLWHRYGGRMPFISNQRLNSYAKLVQRQAGIATDITTHVMRKTFAQMMLHRGVRMETVARMLGHTSTRITERIYCRVSDDMVASEVASVCAGQNGHKSRHGN